MKFFLCVIGMVMIVEGLPYFAFPEKLKMMLEQVLQTEPATLRMVGLILMAAGVCLVYVGHN